MKSLPFTTSGNAVVEIRCGDCRQLLAELLLADCEDSKVFDFAHCSGKLTLRVIIQS